MTDPNAVTKDVYLTLITKAHARYLAEEKAESSRAAWANAWFRVLGITAVVFGVVASSTIITSKYHGVTGWAALAATVLTAASTFWKPLDGKALHERRRAQYWRLAKRIERVQPELQTMSVEALKALNEELINEEGKIIDGSSEPGG
jgi:hypothetical protein